MPRPRKSDSERRTVRREIRLTSSEDAALESRAQERGLTLSDFLRQAALDTRPRLHKAAPDRAALIRGLAELHKIGGNLNQIAKALNQQRAAGFQIIHVPDQSLRDALQGIETLSTHLINNLTNDHHR